MKNNIWRYHPRYWGERIRSKWFDACSRVKNWYFWWSPPWRSTRRCPGCAGEKKIWNSYTLRDCDICQGAGYLLK